MLYCIVALLADQSGSIVPSCELLQIHASCFHLCRSHSRRLAALYVQDVST